MVFTCTTDVQQSECTIRELAESDGRPRSTRYLLFTDTSAEIVFFFFFCNRLFPYACLLSGAAGPRQRRLSEQERVFHQAVKKLANLQQSRNEIKNEINAALQAALDPARANILKEKIDMLDSISTQVGMFKRILLDLEAQDSSGQLRKERRSSLFL